jgi:PhnB protein
MLSDPFPQSTTTPPKELGGTSGSIFMYVDDVDAVVQKAVDAGATVTMEVEDQFWATASARSPTRSATRGRSRRTSRI